MKFIRDNFLALVAGCIFLPSAARGGALAEPEPSGSNHSRWTLYAGQLVDNDLPRFAGDTLRGRLSWQDSYFLGFGYLQPVTPPDWLNQTASWVGLGRVSHDIEWIGLKHFSRQHNSEIAMAYMLHTPQAAFGGLRLRGGGGIGPSLALGRPSAEDGPDNQADKRARLQHYIALEVEATVPRLMPYSMVLRLHHRSGVYGLVAPNGVGSNFVTLGLRFAF